MPDTCPWCLEDGAGRDARLCSLCGHTLVDAEGRRLRPIDLRYELTVTAQRNAVRAYLLWGTLAAATASFVSPFVTGVIHFFVSVPVLLTAHGLSLHFVLLRKPRNLLGRRRQYFNRITWRLFFLPAAVFGYANTAIPFAGALIGAVTFAVLSTLGYIHVMWSLHLERERAPLSVAEKIFFGIVVSGCIAGLFALAALALFASWFIPMVLEWLRPDS